MEGAAGRSSGEERKRYREQLGEASRPKARLRALGERSSFVESSAARTAAGCGCRGRRRAGGQSDLPSQLPSQLPSRPSSRPWSKMASSKMASSLTRQLDSKTAKSAGEGREDDGVGKGARGDSGGGDEERREEGRDEREEPSFKAGGGAEIGQAGRPGRAIVELDSSGVVAVADAEDASRDLARQPGGGGKGRRASEGAGGTPSAAPPFPPPRMEPKVATGEERLVASSASAATSPPSSSTIAPPPTRDVAASPPARSDDHSPASSSSPSSSRPAAPAGPPVLAPRRRLSSSSDRVAAVLAASTHCARPSAPGAPLAPAASRETRTGASCGRPRETAGAPPPGRKPTWPRHGRPEGPGGSSLPPAWVSAAARARPPRGLGRCGEQTPDAAAPRSHTLSVPSRLARNSTVSSSASAIAGVVGEREGGRCRGERTQRVGPRGPSRRDEGGGGYGTGSSLVVVTGRFAAIRAPRAFVETSSARDGPRRRGGRDPGGARRGANVHAAPDAALARQAESEEEGEGRGGREAEGWGRRGGGGVARAGRGAEVGRGLGPSRRSRCCCCPSCWGRSSARALRFAAT